MTIMSFNKFIEDDFYAIFLQVPDVELLKLKAK